MIFFVITGLMVVDTYSYGGAHTAKVLHGLGHAAEHLLLELNDLRKSYGI